MLFSKVLWVGKPLSSAKLQEQRLRKLKALPILSSDALSSISYGTEEILHVLILAGISALSLSLPIAMVICGLITILGASYWQTIRAYPNGGGAFTVARENLGSKAGLLAASALLLDYLLTVAVSISAGVRALTSAFPIFIPSSVLLGVLAIVLIAWINLRGVRESANVFALPTYLFIGLMLGLIATGIYKMSQGQLLASSIPVETPPADSHTLVAVTVLLILRAFSAGCSALTGIECIANSVPVFKAPQVSNANKTLVVMLGLLIVMFFGITYIADRLHIQPQEEQSVVSQISRAVFGDSWLYYALQAATMLILFLAANTAFTGFPRLASILSDNQYLPKQLSNLGDRLSFSNGVFVLAGLSALLVWLFDADTHALIPLYSVGVFLAFSLSQLGMVKRWIRLKTRGWHVKAGINLLGFIATGVALLVIIDSKFMEGAWIIVTLIPAGVMIFSKIHLHYKQVEHELSVTPATAKAYLKKLGFVRKKVIVPVSKLHRGTLAALQFARTISTDVTAVAVNVDAEQTERLKSMWNTMHLELPLVILDSPYRSTIMPLKKYIMEQDRRNPESGLCVIILPEAIPTRWWHYLLHNHRATWLKASLYYNGQHRGNTRVFVDVPYQLRH